MSHQPKKKTPCLQRCWEIANRNTQTSTEHNLHQTPWATPGTARHWNRSRSPPLRLTGRPAQSPVCCVLGEKRQILLELCGGRRGLAGKQPACRQAECVCGCVCVRVSLSLGSENTAEHPIPGHPPRPRSAGRSVGRTPLPPALVWAGVPPPVPCRARGAESVWRVSGECLGSVWGVSGECLASVWGHRPETPSVWESVGWVLRVSVGAPELKPRVSGPPPTPPSFGQGGQAPESRSFRCVPFRGCNHCLKLIIFGRPHQNKQKHCWCLVLFYDAKHKCSCTPTMALLPMAPWSSRSSNTSASSHRGGG